MSMHLEENQKTMLKFCGLPDYLIEILDEVVHDAWQHGYEAGQGDVYVG